MTKVTVGADPEIFLGHKGHFVSAHNLLPGTKYEPYSVERGAVQVDGMAAEFNIDPAASEEEFLLNLDTVLEQLSKMVPDYEFLQSASVMFDKKFLAEIPASALELGCEPDFCAYTRGINQRPNQEVMMRTAGGHVHIGGFESENPYETTHFNEMSRIAMAMDETVGLYSLAWDKDDKRRTMYGRAGTFRPKTYGVEYRTLSNAWLFNKKLQSFVYRGVLEAVERAFDKTWRPNSKIASVINQSYRQWDGFKEDKKWDEVNDLLQSA